MMIEVAGWLIIFLLLNLIQYFFGERYLIIRKDYKKAGRIIVILIELTCLFLGCYIFVFINYLEFLGIIFVLITVFLSFRFIDRDAKKSHPKERDKKTAIIS